ncbi:MAG: sigma-54-dependent Fis family transcriptional regulator [Deltaproteobacteria bacterium]|nr:sigma-54-dependent Fis family transcriptional regulator [Deltaproteobacteria bacterium]
MIKAGYDLLIVDDEESVTKLFERLAKQEKYSYEIATEGQEALDFIAREPIAVVLLDLNLPRLSGFEILEFIRSNRPDTEVVVITGRAKIEDAVKALKLGAFDYLVKPFDSFELVLSCIRQAYEKYQLKRKVKQLEAQQVSADQYEGLIGRSYVMQEIYRTIQNIGPSTSSVLLLGESGTGKELIARAIHRSSPRKDKPFVVINCSAIPETLMESELFGHVRGAFTGATQDKKGLFEEADGGTVFLDEIGEIPLSIQVKLLRVLQEREIRKVGGAQNKSINVRIIAATHQDLSQMIEKGSFREDLYYRLNVITIHLPALRQRIEDIPQLAYHFLKKMSQRVGKTVDQISLDALQTLQFYAWPGNVRELENIIERCVVLCADSVVQVKDLPPKLLTKNFFFSVNEEFQLSDLSYKEAKQKALDIFHRNYLKHLLGDSHGNITLASEKAGLDRSNFKKIVKKYDVDTKEFRKEEG